MRIAPIVLRFVDWLAYLILAVGVLACGGTVIWCAWYVLAGLFGYLFSREGKGLLLGCLLVMAVLLAVRWLGWRKKHLALPECFICGEPGTVKSRCGRWCCGYHGRAGQ